MISVEKTGKTVDDAILAALIELDVDRDNVEIEVIEEGSKGFLGLVGSRLSVLGHCKTVTSGQGKSIP